MKIALIVRKYQTSGGTERYNYNLSKYLSQKNHQVTVICNKANIAPPNNNIEIVKLPNFPVTRTIKTFLFNYMVLKKIKLNEFDIVQGCGKITCQDIYRAGGGFHKLYMKSSNIQGTGFYDKIMMKIEKKIYNVKNTKYVIAVSDFIAKEIHNEFNYPENRIKVFHNSVDLRVFNVNNREENRKKVLEKLKIDEKNIIFLFVANNFKLKGFLSIVNVLKSVENYKLFVVGNDNFSKIANDIPEAVRKNIVFFGEKKGKELIEIYHATHVLLHPTYFDPFANVCLEAMACGAVVVTTKINGASEILENNVDGMVIEHAENIKQLKDAIQQLIKNENFLKTVMEKSKKKVLNYSLENYCERIIEFYKKVRREKFSMQ